MDNKRLDTINWKQKFPDVPQCVHDAVTEANHIVSQKTINYRKRISKKGILLLAATLTLFSGMTAFAATSLWQQRMEEMNEQEMMDYFSSITMSNAPAFRYNRSMTNSEKTLYNRLQSAYELEGVFPKGMLTMLLDDEEYDGKGVGYESQSGTFFLPDSEITEEQMLQIIDFHHKVEYSLQQISMQIENGEIENLQKDEEKTPLDMLQYEAINEQVSYLHIALEGVKLPKEIAAGKTAVYLGYSDKIQRMPVGTSEVIEFYRFNENEQLYAMDADKENNLFLSIRVYDDTTDSTTNKLVKIDAMGQVVTEYDMADAVTLDGKKLSTLMAYKMQESADGKLFVKTFWADSLVLFVFNADGSFSEAISAEECETHPAGEMCLVKDGNLYVLGKQEILCVDTETLSVTNKYAYATEDMVATVDLLYPMTEEDFYLFSYDGLYCATLGENASEKILAAYESDVFEEGARCYPINNNTLVVANYEDWGVWITYLVIGE